MRFVAKGAVGIVTAVFVGEVDASRATRGDLSRKVRCKGVCRCEGVELTSDFLYHAGNKFVVGAVGMRRIKVEVEGK